jgi:hypothetical protein
MNTNLQQAFWILPVTDFSKPVGIRIIYEWGTFTGAIRRLRFEIVNIEIMQRVFVIKKKIDAIGLV